MTRPQHLFYGFFISILLSSCWGWGSKPVPSHRKVWGYKPVYTTDSSFLIIRSGPAKAMKHAGKIYAKDSYIYQVDIGSGIHVIDNSQPANAVPVGFLTINGCSEISIKGNHLYTNCYDALVVVDIANWQQVREVSRIPGAFKQGTEAGGFQHFFIPLPEKNVFYDCTLLEYSPTRIHSGWVRDSVYDYCYY